MLYKYEVNNFASSNVKLNFQYHYYFRYFFSYDYTSFDYFFQNKCVLHYNYNYQPECQSTSRNATTIITYVVVITNINNITAINSNTFKYKHHYIWTIITTLIMLHLITLQT